MMLEALVQDGSDAWLPAFFEVEVSFRREQFDRYRVWIWQHVMEAAACASPVDAAESERLAGVSIIAKHALEQLGAAAAQKEQDREQLHRSIAALHVVSAAWRAVDTLMDESSPTRAMLLGQLEGIVRQLCGRVEVPQKVLKAVEEMITFCVHSMTAPECGRIADTFAELALESNDGNTQQTVRAVSLLAGLGRLGLGGSQYLYITRAMSRVAAIAQRCNHQMRLVIISLLYRFFYITSIVNPEWLVAEASRAGLPGVSVCNIDAADREEMTRLRTDVWTSLASALETVPKPPVGEEVPASKEVINVAKVLALSMCGSQAVVVWGHEVQALRLLLRAASITVVDGDDLRSVVNSAGNSVAFQRHSAESARALAETALACLEDPTENKHSRELAAVVVRVVGYLNQYQWTNAADFERFAKRLQNACIGAFDHAHTALREQARKTFAVFCRLLRLPAVRGLVQRCVRCVTAQVKGSASPADSPASAQAVYEPEATVISLSAAVRACCEVALAYPESIPPFMPKLLMKLARWSHLMPSSFPTPAAHADAMTAIKDALKAWWRSHRDEWAYRHSKAFTTEQQEFLAEHFAGTNYYV